MAGEDARHSPGATGPARIPFVGLTGGIAAGKSEALAALDAVGAATLSSDAVVHELLDDDEVREALVNRYGPVVAPGGRVDRAKLGELVFAEPDERSWLERELWPRVGERVASWYSALGEGDSSPRAAVVEVPLLFESGMERIFDSTLAVVADEGTRAERAGARGHAGLEERTSRQLSQAEKAERADFVAQNDGSLEELRATLSTLLDRMSP